MNKERVVLVDENDSVIGTEEKLTAHREGKLHRAFSIFIFNAQGKLLLQKRADNKYHSGGLWSNTCCGHPQPDEPVAESARGRLKEEMGFSCALSALFCFTYRRQVTGGLIENEIDHVFCGSYSGSVQPDTNEVTAYRWVQPAAAVREAKQNPEQFTAWFLVLLEKVTEVRERK